MNISGQTAGLFWGTLLMMQEHSRPLSINRVHMMQENSSVEQRKCIP